MADKFKCIICGGFFPFTAFRKQKGTKRGCQYECNVCLSLCGSIRHAKRHKERKAYLINIKGGKCEHCGQVVLPYLFDFHHLNPEEKELSNLTRVPLTKALRELKKCILLCCPCHKKEHRRLQDIIDADNITRLNERVAYYSGLSNAAPS